MKRRTTVATVPKNLRLTQEGIDLVQEWATKHETSFSAAMETLARIGLGQAPEVALAPAIVSTIRHTLRSEQERIIRLVVHNIVETGVAARMASAAVKYQRQAEPGIYEIILKKAQQAAKRNLSREKIATVIRELEVLAAEEGVPGTDEPATSDDPAGGD